LIQKRHSGKRQFQILALDSVWHPSDFGVQIFSSAGGKFWLLQIFQTFFFFDTDTGHKLAFASGKKFTAQSNICR
jgi:hypothetical protein